MRVGLGVLVLALGLPGAAAAPGAAQASVAVEVRAGVAYSTPFVRGVALVPAEFEATVRDLEMGPALAPFAELALAVRPEPPLAFEVRAGTSVVRVMGRSGGYVWSAGRATVVHVLGGVRVPLPFRELDVRVGAGKTLYLSGDVNLLEGSERTGVLLAAGVGYRLPGPLPWIGMVEGHRHEFDPDPLAEAGVGAGAVTRFLVHLAVPVRGWDP